MARPEPGEITLLLTDTNNPESLRTVMQLAYGELHDMAARRFHHERPGSSTLQPTALLHEACFRLMDGSAVFKNRKHFFGAASKAMRRILIDGARRRHATKRGGDWRRMDFGEAERIGFEQPSELLDFHVALTRLEAFRPLWSEVAELRVFGGCSTQEAAIVLGIGASTARRRWFLGKKWLRDTLTGDPRRREAKSKQN